MEKKAEYIMKKAIQNIKEEFPPLIYALNLLSLKSAESLLGYTAIGTDKEYLLYCPAQLINAFRYGGMKRIQYLILHTVMHGLLGHWELDGSYGVRWIFYLALDREVGHLLEELGYKEEVVCDANEDISELLGECYDMGVYFRLQKDKRLIKRFFNKHLAVGLLIDNHELWRKKKEKQKKKEEGEFSAHSEKENEKKWNVAREVFCGASRKVDGKSIAGMLKASQASRFGNEKGYGAGDMTAQLEAAKENETSYYEILQQFLKNTKEQKATPEAIDYTLYQYGLELYGDVPLIEPPDSEELLELNTICLAIDTSGSCSGEVAEKFLRETYNLFRDLQNISTGGEVYLFQCDDKIQNEEYYEQIGDLSEVMEQKKRFWGFGGTSFIPVFERISQLEEDGKKIDCLIYLSDAYGDFPEKEPEYPVFFVLDETEDDIKSNYWLQKNVPEWVTLVGIGRK